MPIKESVTIDEVLEVLNRAAGTDSQAMYDLVKQRVPCNEALRDDPTIQVGTFDGKYQVGVLGILNGVFGVDEDNWGPIAACITPKNKQPIYFHRVTGDHKKPSREGE